MRVVVMLFLRFGWQAEVEIWGAGGGKEMCVVESKWEHEKGEGRKGMGWVCSLENRLGRN
jgi:hypothetical protein